MSHSFPALPPLEGLLAVAAASRSGSLTAAAEELGLTHGAVSRRIAAVEAWMGSELFERHGRGVRPTPAGHRLVRASEEAFALIRAAAEPWRGPKGTRTLQISVVPSFARMWLMPRMPALQGDDLRLELRLEHQLAEVDGGQVDLAVRQGPGDWPPLNATLLMRETLIPVASPGMAGELAGESPSALLGLPLINDSNARQWRCWFAAHGLRYRPRPMDRRFEDYDMVLAAAEAGLGVALLRSPMADERMSSGRLVDLGLGAVANPWGHYLVTRADEARPEVGVLIERLLNFARA